MSDFTDSSDDEISTPETPSQTQTMSTNPTPQITRSNPSFASIIFILTLLLATYLLRLQPSKKEVTSYKPYNAGGYGRVISLELGEHYSRVAVIDNGVPVVILNELYEKQTPNYVQFWEDSVTVGEEAQWCASLWPKDHMAEYFIYGVRRLLGRKFSEDRTLTKDIDKLRYKVVGKDDKPIIEAKIGYTSRATLFSPEEITAEVVKRLKGDAETYLNTSITHCVLTLPSYFNDAQRQATRDAATLGGLETVRVLNEPVAAGIAYKLDRQKPKEGEFEVLSLVYDLGESCVDITLLSVELGVFEIMGSAHSRSYGGMDLDRVLERDFPEEVKDPITGLVILDGTWLDRALKKLRRHLDALPFAFPHRLPSGAFSMRSKSSMRWEELFEHSIPHLSNLLHSAKLEKSEITSLILTGTPSQTAKIRPFLEAFFNNKKVLGGIDPSEAVVMGAAIQAGILSGEGETSCDGWFMYDVSVLRLGVEMGNGVFEKVVARNTVIATRMARNFTTTVDGQTKLVIGIFEGERLMAEHNKLLETLELDNLKSGPAGGVTIEVAFEIDDNYHLMVTAREIGDGGASAKMAKAIDLSGRPGEVTDKIIADAEMHREEDEVRAKAAAEKLDGGGKGREFGIAVKIEEPLKYGRCACHHCEKRWYESVAEFVLPAELFQKLFGWRDIE